MLNCLRSKKLLLLSILVFIVAFLFRVYYISQKAGLHMDEMLTVFISRGTVVEKLLSLHFDENIYTGKEIKKNFFSNHKNSLFVDLSNLRKDNYNDDAHPSLYYSMFRIFTNGVDLTQENIIKYGCGLNLIFFTFSFFIMRKLLIRLFGDNKLVPIGLLVAFLNTGTVSMTLFVRPYEMQMLALIMISYAFVIFLEKNNSIKDYIFLIFSLVFTILSAYFLVVYIGILGIFLIIRYIKDKKYKPLIWLLVCFFVSFLISITIYSGYFSFLKGDRFANVTDSNNSMLVELLKSFIYFLGNIVRYLYYLWVLLVIFIGSFFIKKDLKNSKEVVSLFYMCMLWTLLIAIYAPFNILRYIAPAFPVLALGIVMLMNKMPEKQKNIFCCFVALIYVICLVFPYKMEALDTKIGYKNDKFLKGGASIENLFLDIKCEAFENPNYPVIIKSDFWGYPLFIISKLNDNQKYMFVVDSKEVKHLPFDSDYYVLYDRSLKFSYNVQKDFKNKLLPSGRCYSFNTLRMSR